MANFFTRGSEMTSIWLLASVLLLLVPATDPASCQTSPSRPGVFLPSSTTSIDINHPQSIQALEQEIASVNSLITQEAYQHNTQTPRMRQLEAQLKQLNDLLADAYRRDAQQRKRSPEAGSLIEKDLARWNLQYDKMHSEDDHMHAEPYSSQRAKKPVLPAKETYSPGYISPRGGFMSNYGVEFRTREEFDMTRKAQIQQFERDAQADPALQALKYDSVKLNDYLDEQQRILRRETQNPVGESPLPSSRKPRTKVPPLLQD